MCVHKCVNSVKKFKFQIEISNLIVAPRLSNLSPNLPTRLTVDKRKKRKDKKDAFSNIYS